ncbi:MAG: AAA family ATPase [Deltaproteobacteria bacterium]
MIQARRATRPERMGVLAALLCWSLALSWTASARASTDAGAADGGVADAGAPVPEVEEFQTRVGQIRAFLEGQLDPDVEPQSLFEIPLDASDEVVRVEQRRIQLLQRVAAPAIVLLPDLPTVRASVWQARLELDRERLAFYSLPAARRAELLRQHAQQQQQQPTATQRDHEAAINEADRVARRAEQQQRQALEAARLAGTEAARLINEEYARLLAITQRQAEFEQRQIQRRLQLEARNEAMLGWRRRVAEVLSAGPAVSAAEQARADGAYVELRVTLRQARELLSNALGSIGDGQQGVPRPGPDPLIELPADAERGPAERERNQVTAKALELTALQKAVDADVARQLMGEIEALNHLRLDLLTGLSYPKRESVLGFGPSGWAQAASELRQVVLTSRYHVRAAYEWLVAVRRGDQRGQSAWLLFLLVIKAAFPIGLFVWWRRHAERLLEELRRRMREAGRARRGNAWFAVGNDERLVTLLRRVRRPLEWLLLTACITWLMPPQMRDLLEARLASSVLFWVLGGALIVLTTDAVFSGPTAAPSRWSGAAETASLRLRSLHLVGRSIVAFGLVLSLSEQLVGPGTIYSWVFSTCWFAAVPILLIIVAWWRPFIFGRFSHMRRPNGFEQWVLSRRSPPPNVLASTLSSIAAVAGGIYLFVLGALRVARNRVLTFTLTRRLLAYLFRRDLSKKAREAPAPECASLSGDVYRALGPETASTELVRSVADAQVEEVIRRIKASGGGAMAIVGERGAGKTTLIERIVGSGSEIISLTCTADGLPALRSQLNLRLGLQPNSELEVAAASLDHGGNDRGLLIDDAQYLVRPMMGGLADFDRVLALFRAHSRNCTWILAFDETIWGFIERTRGVRPLFDDVIRLSPWDEAAIVRLITRRNEAAAIQPDFRQLALDLAADADEIDLQEAVRRIEANYYRLLWDYAAGNPGVALHFWRRSLGLTPSGGALVRLFDAPDAANLEALPESAAFVLRAIIQLGWATPEDIHLVTALPGAQVQDALRYGRQRGYFDVDGQRVRITWDWFRAVTRFLQRRHLLFSAS